MPLLDRTGLIDPPALDEVVIAGDTAPAEALVRAEAASLVVIDFASGSDGRGFSLGRALRERGFAGRLHARGELIPEQFAFALRLGFDAVEISDARLARQPLDQWLTADHAFSNAYQGENSIFDRRRAARSAA